jgi:hypothetical protein
MKKVKKVQNVCSYCNEEFQLTDVILPYSNKKFHKECLIKYFVFNGRPKLSYELSVEKVRLIESEESFKLQESFKKQSKKLQNSKLIFETKQKKQQLLDWIYANYEMYITWGIEKRLEEISNGTFKGLYEAIPYDVLLDMFVEKKIELDDIYNKNKNRGKYFNNNEGRFFYDLKILISGYFSYKKQQIQISKASRVSETQEEEYELDSIIDPDTGNISERYEELFKPKFWDMSDLLED